MPKPEQSRFSELIRFTNFVKSKTEKQDEFYDYELCMNLLSEVAKDYTPFADSPDPFVNHAENQKYFISEYNKYVEVR